MYRTYFLLFILLLITSPLSALAAVEKDLQAAFIREGNLWLYSDGKEKLITADSNVFTQPKWSRDGDLLLYQKEVPSELQANETQSEIWSYDISTGEHKRVFYDGYGPQWAPDKNIIAFNNGGILNISDIKQFYNIAGGVNGFSWLPDGSGFLLSSSGNLKPDGWTSAVLYKKKLAEEYEKTPFVNRTEHFFTLPKEVGINNNKVISVNAGHFEYSPSNAWISFIVSPTASMAMDSNMLCVISKDGKGFQVLDEVIFGVGEPKWAPGEDTIAFIGGGGRIVFGFKDKQLKVREMPAAGTLTPSNFADLDFDWISNNMLVTSRVEEREWSNDFKKHPLPILYTIDLKTKKQVEISTPPKGFGDYHPKALRSVGKILWLRGTSITDEGRTAWIANPDGSDAKEWLKNVDAVEVFENGGLRIKKGQA